MFENTTAITLLSLRNVQKVLQIPLITPNRIIPQNTPHPIAVIRRFESELCIICINKFLILAGVSQRKISNDNKQESTKN